MSEVAQWLACWAHNPKVPGSKPGFATHSPSWPAGHWLQARTAEVAPAAGGAGQKLLALSFLQAHYLLLGLPYCGNRFWPVPCRSAFWATLPLALMCASFSRTGSGLMHTAAKGVLAHLAGSAFSCKPAYCLAWLNFAFPLLSALLSAVDIGLVHYAAFLLASGGGSLAFSLLCVSFSRMGTGLMHSVATFNSSLGCLAPLGCFLLQGLLAPREWTLA